MLKFTFFKERLIKKFQKAKSDYQIRRKNIVKHPKDNKKIPRYSLNCINFYFKRKTKIKLKQRMLTTCPTALKMLLVKTSLNKHELERDEDENSSSVLVDQHYHASSSTVAFNVDFVKYYHGKFGLWLEN